MLFRGSFVLVFAFALGCGGQASAPTTEGALPARKIAGAGDATPPAPENSTTPPKKTAPPLPDPKQPNPDDATKNLVVVTLRQGDAQHHSPGVFARQGGVPYVLVPLLPGDGQKQFFQWALQAAQESGAVEVLVSSVGEKPKRVSGKVVGHLPRENMLAIRLDEDTLGAPGWKEQVAYKDGQKVKLFGLRKSGVRYVTVEAAGAADRVFETPEGKLDGFFVKAESAPGEFSLVLNERGYVLGIATFHPQQIGGLEGVEVRPIARLENFGRPMVTAGLAIPVAGNDEQVDYQFIVRVQDPMDRLGKSPKLTLVRRSDPPEEPKPQPPGDPRYTKKVDLGEWAPWGQRPKAPRERPEDRKKLVVSCIDEALHPLASKSMGTETGRILVAKGTVPNTGDPDSDEFETEIQTDPPGESLTTLLVFPRVIMGEKEKNLPRIPGLDGIPLGGPHLTQLDDQRWRITSAITRPVKEDQVATKKDPYSSKAVPSTKPLAKSEEAKAEGWKLVLLDLNADKKDQKVFSRPMTYSPDGAYLYVIDGEDQLRKIRTRDLTLVLSRKLERRDSELWHSAGHLVVVQEHKGIAVLNPETFETVRFFPLPAVCGSASPAHEIAFASHPSGLWMLDLASGEILHYLPQHWTVGTQQLTFHGDTGAFPAASSGKPRQDVAGKYVYIVGHRTLRYAIDKGHLIYEDVLAADSTPAKFVLSHDGAQFHPLGYCPRGYPYLQIIDPRDFQPKYMVRFESPEGAAFDPKTGNFWAVNRDSFAVFAAREGSDRSDEKLKFKIESQTTDRMLANPAGGQAAVWGTRFSSQLWIYQAPAAKTDKTDK